MRAGVLLVLLCATATAAPMDPAAKAHFEKGLELYRGRDYESAVREFQAGAAIDPHPDFDYPWAQAERLSGDCAGAIPIYQRVLQQKLSREDAGKVRTLIEQCRRAVGPEQPPEPASQPAPPPPAPPRRSTPWYRDTLGDALLGGGVVAAGAGVAFLVLASSAESDLDSAGNLGDFRATADRADRDRLIGGIALGAGAALVTGAVIRYLYRGDEPVTVTATANGLLLGGTF